MAAATTKSLIVSPISSRATLLLVFVVVALAVVQTGQVQAQGHNCPTDLGNLNVCAPFVVPGATNNSPSPDCCSALRSIDHDCICNTIRIASQIPSQCNLPPLACSASNNTCTCGQDLDLVKLAFALNLSVHSKELHLLSTSLHCATLCYELTDGQLR